jgi:hypothetical protein
MAQKRKPLSEASIQEDFDPQAVEQLREQLNLPTVKPINPLIVKANAESVSQSKRSSSPKEKAKFDRPKKINIDIGESRHNRLNEIAAQIRASNTDPVAPSERMYPIHLIQTAIDFLLDGLEIDWDEIQKPEDLREVLNTLKVKQFNR